MQRRFLTASFLGTDFDWALLALRVGIGINLFLKHGLEKIVYYSFLSTHFYAPFGINPIYCFFIASIADVLFSLFIVAGLFIRWCSLYYVGVLLVAWGARHDFSYWNPPIGTKIVGYVFTGDHGELIVLYLVAMITFIIAGAGRYSLDAWIARSDKRLTQEGAQPPVSHSRAAI